MAYSGFGTSGQVQTSNGVGTLASYQPGGGGGSSVGFSATLTASPTNLTGDGTVVTVPFDTLLYDTNSGFDTSTFTYTIPVSGNYAFSVSFLMNNLSAGQTFTSLTVPLDAPGGSLQMQLAVSNPFASGGLFVGTNSYTTSASWVMDMTAGETVIVQWAVIGGTKTVGLQGFSSPTYFANFSGVKI